MLLFLIIWTNLVLHPYYVSMTDLVFNKEEQKIECTSKIFIDDLEDGIFKELGEKVFISNNDSLSFEMIGKYALLNLNATEKSNTFPKDYIGFEIVDDLVYIYISFENWQGENIYFSNSLLVNSISSQKNIVHSMYGNETQTHLFDNKKREQPIIFSN